MRALLHTDDRAYHVKRSVLWIFVPVVFIFGSLAAAAETDVGEDPEYLQPETFGFARLGQVYTTDVMPQGYLGVSSRARYFRRLLRANGPDRQDLLTHHLSLQYGAYRYLELFLDFEERFWCWHAPGSSLGLHWAISDSRLGARARLPERVLGGLGNVLDLACRVEWSLPVGSRAAMSAPGDSSAVRYITTDKVHYTAHAILGVDLQEVGAKYPLKIYVNFGYRDSRHWLGSEFIFSENYPHYVVRDGKHHSALLGGLAVEVPSERYSIFAELTREHALSASDFATFAEMPMKAAMLLPRMSIV